MVQVREQLVTNDGSVDLEDWLEGINIVDGKDEDRVNLLMASRLAREVQLSGEAENTWASSSSFLTGLEMAQILSDLKLDPDALVAAVLYRSVREGRLTMEEIEKQFNTRVAGLIEGVLRMAAIGSLQSVGSDEVFGQTSRNQVDNLRKMLIGIIDDVRVALIKIAERTCAIRAAKTASEEKQRRVAREVRDLYAPLAHRLGIGQIKWELEDLAFRYLEPGIYKQIAHLLDERRVDRQQFIDSVVEQLSSSLAEQNIHADLSGRAKHIFSIWRKMQEKDIGFSQVYDIRAVRILVTTVHECYMVLGIVHRLWRAIPNEFDDYIANPKENGYQSLHTAVIGPQGKVMEIQIKTHWMHEEAEFGVCAHWQYKDGFDKELVPEKKREEEYNAKVEWLRQVLEWHEETGGNRDLIDELRTDIILKRIYVFTPEGHVIELPQGSTPLDFAYQIHTAVGHRCRGARVNGRVVPLNHTLTMSDQVEVITGKHEVPNRDWLDEGMGYIKTPRARSKIHQWFRQQAREQHVVDGSVLLDRELKQLALQDLDLEALAEALGMHKVEDLYAALGSSDIGFADVLRGIQKLQGEFSDQQLSFSGLHEVPYDHHVVGVGNMPVEMAPCCSPSAGHRIGGVIDAGGLVIVHRQDCDVLLQKQADEPASVIKVEWGDEEKTYQVDLQIEAYERVGLLRDITTLLEARQINIYRLLSESDKSTNKVTMALTVEVNGLDVVRLVLAQINQLPNVYTATRRL
jgi:GTP pyrophosphokinase